MKQYFTKRRVMCLALILILTALIAGGSVAYFTAEDTAHNVITSGRVKVELHEWADEDKTEPFPDEPIAGTLPGEQITKIVELENTGSGDAWVRICVSVRAVDSSGQEMADPWKCISIAFNEAPDGGEGDYPWVYGDDGFDYYDTVLAPGETTEPLFTAVSLSPDMGNEFQGCTIYVDVTGYAVQAINNGSSVLEAAGWPESDGPVASRTAEEDKT